MDVDALSYIPKGEHDQHIEADSVCALISQAVQGITLIEAYSYNVGVTDTLDMQKDSKAMSVKDWIITQSKNPATREIKYLINNKQLKGRKVYSQDPQIAKQYLRKCSHLVLCGGSYTDGWPHQRKIEIGSWELSERPAVASEGSMGRGTSCDVASSTLGTQEVMVLGVWCALFGTGPKGREPVSPLQWRREHQGKEPTHQPHEPQLTPGPLTSSQGYLPWLTPAPGVPLAPGGLHSILAQPPPSASSGPEIKEYFY